jgi:hypothetical protein
LCCYVVLCLNAYVFFPSSGGGRRLLVQAIEDGLEELSLRAIAANVLRLVLARFDHLDNGILDFLSVRWQIQMSEQVGRAEQHTGGVGDVAARSG